MDILKAHQTELVIGLAVLVVLQFVFVLGLSGRVKYVRKTLRSLLTGPTGEDLEVMLKRCLEESGRALGRCDQMDTRLADLATDMTTCVRHVGLVRYDGYGDVSGKQSFSLALLDGNNNGALITGLFGRTDGRCFGKAVVAGQTEQGLTEEEDAALQMALSGGVALGNISFTAPALNGKRRLLKTGPISAR